MRKGQLIRMVLKAYKYHIKHLKENFQDKGTQEVTKYLVKADIACGICNFISKNVPHPYYYSGYRAKWVNKYMEGNSDQWAPYPIYRSLEEALKFLQVRVDIMEKELTSGDKLHQRLDSKKYYVED